MHRKRTRRHCLRHRLFAESAAAAPRAHLCGSARFRVVIGSTPAMIAMFLAERDADQPHVKIVEMLLRAGASLTHKNNDGMTVRSHHRK